MAIKPLKIKEIAGAVRLLKNDKVHIFSAVLKFGGNAYCGVLVLTFRRKKAAFT